MTKSEVSNLKLFVETYKFLQKYLQQFCFSVHDAHISLEATQRVLLKTAFTKSSEGWINAVGSVSGCHDDHMSSLFQAVH